MPQLLLNLDLTSAEIYCSGESTAMIISNATGGLGNYQYELLDAANNVLAGPQAGETFSGLAAGSYKVRVLSGDCQEVSAIITIANPAPLTVTSVENDILCFGDANGSISITATGGTGIIQYAISPNLNQFDTDNSFTGLAPGPYQVIVQDQNGCFQLLNFNIDEPAPLVADFVAIQDELCLNAADGSITLSLVGGTGSYEVSLDNINFVTVTGNQYTFTGLSGDTFYQIFVRDSNGCNINPPLEYYMMPAVEVIPDVTVTPTCTNNVPGNTVVVNVNPEVVADVEYSLDDVTYQASNTFTNLAPGNYTAYVRHSNGCTKTDTFVIDNLSPVAATAVVTANVACFGGTTGEITVTASGGNSILQYAISPAFTYGASNVFTGLAAGTYTIRVRDNIGCEAEVTNITVTQPAAALSATVTGTPEICINANDGTITVTVSGGTAPYATSLDNVNFTQGQFSFTGLADGTYTIYVRDANSCTITPLTYTVLPGVDIQPVATVTPNCTNNTPGNVVTVAVNPAVAASVEYSLDGVTYQVSNTFSNVPAGPQTVYVRHSNGCIRTDDFEILPLQPVTATAAVTANVACFGGTTGQVTVTASGGNSTLQYAISPAFTYGGSNVFTGLAAGTYTIRVRDNIGCEAEVTNITVTQPAAALSASAVTTPETCINQGNGSITITISGGTGPYSTRLNTTSFVQGQLVYNNLAAGTYTVFVRDANGCDIVPLTVTVAPGVNIQPNATVTATCTNNTPGNVVTISVNPSVTGSVQYSLDGINYVNNNTFTNVPVSVTTVYVKHTNGCVSTAPVTIPALQPITASATVISNVACFGGTSGAISVTASGGNGALQYAISPAFNYTSSASFTGLSAGSYIIRVRDAAGCEREISGINITQPAAALTATAVATPEACISSNNGSITITISGGTAPYSTRINGSPFAAGQLVYNNLSAGQYTIQVRDANGCTVTPIQVQVQDGVNIQATASVSLVCTGNVPGNIVTVNVNPEVAGQVQYAVDNGTYTSSNTFSNLTTGNHIITVKHVNGCIQSLPVNIQNGVPVNATATVNGTISCFGATTGAIRVTASGGTGGLQYAISPDFNYVASGNFTGLAAGTYTIRVRDAIGCIREIQNIVITQPAAIAVVTADILEEICADDDNGAIEIAISGGTAPYATRLGATGNFVDGQLLFENLNGGQTYTLFVRDANNCIVTHEVTLAPPVDIDARPVIDYGCNATTVTIAVSAAVEGSVTYSLNGGTPQSSNVFVNVPVGPHRVDIVHTLGCTDVAEFTIAPQVPLQVTLAESGLNQLTATATGGSGGYQYSFNGNDNGSSNTFVFLSSGNHTVTVTDSRGCTATANINARFVDIEIPDVVTPNDDGRNDTWSPANTQNYPNITTDIFDRYGRKLAVLRQGQSWDGKYRGNELPTGDYWYIIKLGDPQDSREFVGHFTIYR
ncbi:T9SS type B sorting domain-containing protein [Flavobacterium cyanobacteriorum]|uniref:T9SS type B sorting domain-containing protein n=1 Tax=Flavobacterium cyanobacteriorum TaxID=2022802 RepID=UPI00101AD53F|nr:T9SS type B sorting domain-containing protein [Flavobacterium cyanobacteriorum]